jgi:hypothetical protein
MNNTSDNFEKIAADAVNILAGLAQALSDASDDNNDHAAALLALIIAAQTEDLCDRAIALGAM